MHRLSRVLTQDFISEGTNEEIYKTGDSVCYNVDGGQ